MLDKNKTDGTDKWLERRGKHAIQQAAQQAEKSVKAIKNVQQPTVSAAKNDSLATQYAEWHNIEAQRSDESDSSFCDRVSGALRDAGNIIEAHEVAQDKRYDAEDGDMVMNGIAGAMAMALRGKSYGSHGSSLVGDEIAAGVIATSPKKKQAPMMAMLAMLLFDGR